MICLRDLHIKAIQNYDNENVHNLINLVGLDGTLNLINEHGGSAVYIPKLNTILKETKSKLILKAYNDGLTFKQISEKYGVTNKQIHSIVQYYEKYCIGENK